jgi:putative ABC transport system permease protein
VIPVRYNVRSLAVRKTTTIATSLGVGLVVFVLASALMLSAGVKRTLGISGQDDVAIVLRKGSDAELGSALDVAAVNTIKGGPGVKRDEAGQPLAVGEVVVVGTLEKLGAAGDANVQMRGVSAESKRFRPKMRIVDGRPAKPGSDEVVVGARIRGRFRGTELGQTFDLRKNRPVTVVGVFTDDGSSYESEVWVDVDTLRAGYGREGGVSSVRVKLDSPAAFDLFKAAMEGEKQYGYIALREKEYLEKQSQGTSLFIGVMGTLISIFFAMGAMIGATITMYAAVANRQREIGTLRALGFSQGSILLSFLLEAVFLSLLGGAIGALLSLGMGFVHFSMINFASFSEIVFGFEPTPGIILTSLGLALGMGLVGGFFPALRAARVSPVAAMRG